MDKCYSELCKELLWEMDKFKKLGKRRQTPHKPYWSANLSELWQHMRLKLEAAKQHLHLTSKRKLKRRLNFQPEVLAYVQSQELFDRELRNAKRKYDAVCVENMDRLCNSKNPRDFWKEVDKLGPRTKKDLICEAVDANGNITRDLAIVMESWRESFAKLYGAKPEGDFDECFLHEKTEELNACDELNLDADLNLN